VPRAERPVQRVSIDFWGPYRNGDNDVYYLSMTDDAMRFSWIFITDNRRFETVRDILSGWMQKQERELGMLSVNIRLDCDEPGKKVIKEIKSIIADIIVLVLLN
jgi:hypothetical protein